MRVSRRYAFSSYLAGAVTARAGDEMAGLALMLAGLAATGSPTVASSLLAGATISSAVGGPVLGALLDRARRPGRLLAGALALYAVGLGLVLAALGRAPIGVSLALATCAGLLGPALSGGWTAQLPRVVTPGRLARASALDAMTFSAASLAGPALAGSVAALFGASQAVVVALVLVSLAAPAAWRLPAQLARPGVTQDAGSLVSIGADLVAGIRFIAANRSLARATGASVLSCCAEGMWTAAVPILGERALGGAGHGALLLSCVAVAALIANTVVARFPDAIRPDTYIWLGAVAQAGAMALATVERPTALVVAAILVGVGAGPQLTAVFAVRHREAPDALRGQIFTTGASLKLTAFALGAAVCGPIATHSLATALVAAAILAAIAALTYAAKVPLPANLRRRRDRNAPGA
jgi:MFS family permease